MATIDELKPDQLKNPDVFEKIKELADSFVLHVQAKEAYQLQEKLASLLDFSDLKSAQPELYKEYRNLLTKLKWTASPIISEEEFLRLIRENYLPALENENIDAQDRIEIKMFSAGLFPRNELRQKIYRAVKENKEKLGPRTIGEWITDYSITFDFQERTKTTHLDYLSKSPEAQSLSEKEKDILKKVLWTLDSLLIVTPVMSEPALSETYGMITSVGVIRKPIPFPRAVEAPAVFETKKEVMPTPLDLEEKPKKPGLFKKLFSSRPSPKPSIYEKKISPYEIKRELPKKPSKIASILTRPIFTIDVPHPEPPKAEEIKTFSEEMPQNFESEEKTNKPTETKPQAPSATLQYQIRTMRSDIEKVKKQPIPQKPEPKIKDNIVDLSGK